MTFTVNSNMQKEIFPDGDILYYDKNTETFHILNITASKIVELISNYNYEDAKKIFLHDFLSITMDKTKTQEIENDFDATFKELVNKKIILTI